MPSTRLKLDQPYRNWDDSTPSTHAHLIQDGYLDKAGAFHRRPGLKQNIDLSQFYPELAGQGGLGEEYYGGNLIVVVAGRVFKITDKHGLVSSVTELTGATLTSTRRVTFAQCVEQSTNTTYLFMANGGQVVYTDGSTLNYINDGGTGNIPTRVTHVVSVDTYLVVNNLDEPVKFRICATPGDPLDWTTTPQEYSVQNEDISIEALESHQGKLMVVGQSSLEWWQNDGVTPFSVIVGATSGYGSENPYAVSVLDNDLAFLTNTRDIVALNGYTPTILSEAYAKEIQSLGVVADVSSDWVSSIGGRKYLIFNFPDSGRTIVFNHETTSFSEWGSVDANGQYNIFKAHCYTYHQGWGYHLLLDRNNPIVYVLSPEYYDDNGSTMRTELVTGWYDHGVSQQKKSRRLTLNVRRGQATLTHNRELEQTYNSALLYNMMNDASRTDTNVFYTAYTIKSRVCTAVTYNDIFGHTPSKSVLNTDGIAGQNIVMSFWATGIYRSSGSPRVWVNSPELQINTSGGDFFVFQKSGATYNFNTYNSISYTPTTSMHHYVVLANGAAGTLSFYIDGVLQTPTATSTSVISPVSLTNITLGSGTQQTAFYDFSLFDYSLLSSKSDDTIVDDLYNNAALSHAYEFVNEFSYNLYDYDAVVLYMSFRDDGNEAWSEEIMLDLGTLGNTNTPIVLQGMGGIYYQRQYRFVFGDNAPLTINSIEEDVVLMA